MGEELFRGIFVRHEAVMFLVDPEGGTIVDINEAAVRACGFGRDEIAGRPLTDICVDPPETIMANLAKARRAGSTLVRTRHRTAGGEVLDVEVQASLMRLGGRELFLSVVHDITDRVAAEAGLAESRNLYRRLVEAVSAIHWEMDYATERFTYVSPQAEAILGYPLSDWTDLAFWVGRVHPDDREWAVRYCREASERGRDHDFVYRMISASGRTVWLRDSVQVTSRGGRPLSLRGIMIDVTHMKEAEDLLKKSEARFRAMFEDHAAVMFLVDPFAGRILDANHAAARFHGRTREELASLKIWDINMLDSGTALGHMAEAMRRRRNYFLFKHRAAGGEMRDVEVYSSPIRLDDREVLFSIIHDVTVRLWAERELKRDEGRLDALHQLSRMHEAAEDEMAAFVLDRGLALTESSIGFIGLVDEGSVEAVKYRWSRSVPALDEAACEALCAKIAETGLIAGAGADREPLVVNDCAGPEEGGPPIGRHIVVPVFEDGRAVYVGAVANKAEPYGEADARHLSLLLEGFARHIGIRRAAWKVAESEERFRNFFESAGVGMAIADAGGTIFMINEAGAALLGCRVGEIVGKKVSDFLPPSGGGGDSPFEGLLAGRVDRVSEEKRFVRRDGQTAWALLTVSLTRCPEGAPPRLILQFEDITGPKRSEAEREELIQELRDSLENAHVLGGLVPICSYCKNIRNDAGYWSRVEEFFAEHLDATVDVGLCPECEKKVFGAQEGAGSHSPLSARETEVLAWISRGKSTGDIALLLGITESTVKFHVKSIMRKLDVVTRSQAVAVALQLGLLSHPLPGNL